VGYLAERRQDRQFATSWTAMLAGTVLIYAARCGWLAHSLGVPFYSGDGKDAFSYGLTPFIAGDMLKLTLGAAITPVASRFVERGTRD
jgi:biotin transport system substrate-specific component